MTALPEMHGQVAPPAVRRRRLYHGYLLLLLAGANALSYADRQLFAILAPAIKAEFSFSDAQIGAIGGPAFMIPFVLFSLPAARLADRWSRRYVLAGSVALWSGMTALCGMANAGWHMAVARMGIGMGEAGGSPPAQSVIAGSFPPALRSRALSIFSSGTYIGVIASLWGGAAIAQALGWRAAFLFLALPGLAIAPAVLLTAPRRSPDFAPSAAPPLMHVVRDLWRIPSFRFLALAAGLLGIFSYVASTWMPSYFVRSHGLSIMQTGFWIGVTGTLGGISGTVASGWLTDWLSPQDSRWQIRVPAIATLLSALALTAVLLVPSGAMITIAGRQLPLVGLLSPFGALLTAIWMPASFAAVANLVPPALRSQAAALLIIVLTVIGAGIGPMMAGLLSDALRADLGEEALRYAMLISVSTLVVSAALFWRAADHYPFGLAAAGSATHDRR
jgi:MFS family permease